MDFEQARFNMVEQQIRTWDVLDQDVLALLFEVKREDFVPPAYRAIAFTDMEIPLGHDQVMMSPKMEARVIQELDLKPADRVLEIGTGSGYLTSLLARRSSHVTSIEYHPALSTSAAVRLAAAGIGNISLTVGDGMEILAGPADSRYDVIVLTGSMPTVPPAWLDRLNPGGRLFAVVGDLPVMEATLTACEAPGKFTSVKLFETVLRPLINSPQPSRFAF